MANNNFAVIGLGKFGASVAITLNSEGKHVLAIDLNIEKIEDIKNNVTWAKQADATDKEALIESGITNCDCAIVAIGEDMDSSILSTLNLKELGIKQIVAKAKTEQQGKVLTKIGADRVVFPEVDTGKRLAWQLMTSDVLEYIEVSPQYAVKDVEIPRQFIGKEIKELHVGTKFNILILSVNREKERIIVPSGDLKFGHGDKITIVGKTVDVKKFSERFKTDRERAVFQATNSVFL